MTTTPASQTTQPNEVVRLLQDRRATNSQPLQRKDGRSLALIVEGGAMRGVVSAGMVGALEELNLRDCFDTVYGSSAGAISGAYFVARQARYGTTIFYDNINNSRFVSLWRLFGSNPVVSLEFLLDSVCRHNKPLHADRVISSEIPLRVVASSLDKKKSVVLGNFQDSNELFEALRASARIPFFAGRPVEFRQERYLDASIYESIPFQAAVNDGATDLLILLTRPEGDLRSTPNWIDRNVVAPHLARIDPDLARHYLQRAVEYRKEIEAIATHAGTGPSPRMYTIQIPKDACKVRSLETDRLKLVQGAMDGFRAVYQKMGLVPPPLAEIITPVED